MMKILNQKEYIKKTNMRKTLNQKVNVKYGKTNIKSRTKMRI